MIRELSELGMMLRTDNASDKRVHNALKEEPIAIDLVILEDGSFVDFVSFDKRMTTTEALTSKKGKARLLVDKTEEVLGYCDAEISKRKVKLKRELTEKEIEDIKKGIAKKHGLFWDKIQEYKDLPELQPVLCFYESNKINGVDCALSAFGGKIPEKERGNNIAFRVMDKRIHERPAVIESIIARYTAEQTEKLTTSSKKCSICGKNDYPVEDLPHGMIKRVPDGQSIGCALISFNFNAVESYDLPGNMNSSICTNCARTYVEGLNWLMTNGITATGTDAKGKQQEVFRYTNRRNFGSDTAMVYWTRHNTHLEEIDILEQPTEGSVAKLIESVISADKRPANSLKQDTFYACTLSGAAARIAVRDWIETSLEEFRQNIKAWFDDILILQYDKDQKKLVNHFGQLYKLATSCQNRKESNHYTLSRTASSLWNVALKRSIPPLWILANVLKRAKLEGVNSDRAALIRLVLNRNHKGGQKIMEKLDGSNKGTAYISGRIFAVLESIQYAALGKTNAGIRDRFFSSASTTPSTAFGRLMKMSQHHLSKLKGEKPGLAIFLDKELGELCSKIVAFPVIFSLEEQGQFAIGYYHQRQERFNKSELKEIQEEA